MQLASNIGADLQFPGCNQVVEQKVRFGRGAWFWIHWHREKPNKGSWSKETTDGAKHFLISGSGCESWRMREWISFRWLASRQATASHKLYFFITLLINSPIAWKMGKMSVGRLSAVGGRMASWACHTQYTASTNIFLSHDSIRSQWNLILYSIYQTRGPQINTNQATGTIFARFGLFVHVIYSLSDQRGSAEK